MSKRTPIFDFYTMEINDTLYPGYDQDNFHTVENQISAHYQFVQPGVLSGWLVTPMAGDHVSQKALIDGYNYCQNCALGTNYQLLGLLTDLHLADVKLATTGSLVSIYNNGSGTLTNSGTQVALTIDGVAVSAGDRILVKNQSVTYQNGVYVVTSVGSNSTNWVLTRSTDLNTNGAFKANLVVRVTAGAVNIYGIWVLESQTSYVLGTTPIHWIDVWSQTFMVSPGEGIIDVYSAKTTTPAFFRLTAVGTYYVWADDGLCLITEHLAQIVCPLNGNYNFDQTTKATYLATVTVTQTDSDPFVYEILYDSRRNNLQGLQGAADAALQLYFYRHVHLGGPNHPSKILLSTSIVLTASGPAGSTIFILLDSTGAPFTQPASHYGFPTVLLNDVPMLPTSYNLEPGSPWKIYLKNSLPANAILQVVLPLSPQIKLFLNSSVSAITDATIANSKPIYLTDGTKDSDGNYVNYVWSDALYLPPDVSLTNINTGVTSPVNPALYTVQPSSGSIDFNPALSGSLYNDSSLKLIITKVGREVQGILDGKRVINVDASTFTEGTLDSNRLSKLDHVGQVRQSEVAKYKPHLRLFADGDHLTFYPEIIGSDLQFSTTVYTIFQSQNIPNISLGTPRGLLNSTDFARATVPSSWNPDFGQPIFMLDEVCHAVGANKLNNTYILTKEGLLYRSNNLGLSWPEIYGPVVNSVVLPITAFWAWTLRVETDLPSGLVTYTWQTNQYAGTAHNGLWTRSFFTGAIAGWNEVTLHDLGGSPLEPANVGKVNTVFVMDTLQQSTSSDGTVTQTINQTLYTGTENGLFVGANMVRNDAVQGLLWLQNGVANQGENNIIWWTYHDVFITHTAVFNDDGQGNTYWTTPLGSGYFNSANQITDCVAATTLPVTLSGTQVVDGVTVGATSSPQRVLVKNQVTLSQNGTYSVASGVWTKQLSELHPNHWVNVTGGSVNNGSKWFLPTLPSSYGSGDDVVWEIAVFPIVKGLSTYITNVVPRVGTTDYYILHTGGIILATDLFTPGAYPAYVNLPWDASQGSPLTLLSLNSSTNPDGKQIVGTTKGTFTNGTSLYASTPVSPWVRLDTEFTASGPVPTVFDETTGTLLTGWQTNDDNQSFIFSSLQSVGTNLLYERDYTTYYVDPWIGTGADVFIFINGSPSLIPYSFTPTTGQIVFATSLGPSDVVTVTIIRLGAYISNVGINPHSELSNFNVVRSTPAAYLSVALSPTDSTMLVTNPGAFTNTDTMVQLVSGSNIEKFFISVDPVTLAITIPYARVSNITFPAQTSIYIVENKTKFGIEDLISQYQTNQPYNLNSVGGVNLLQMSIGAKAHWPNVFDNFVGEFPDARRGPVDTVLFDFSSDTLDPRATSSSLYTGVIPSITDTAVSPHAVYAMSYDSDGFRIGTEQGIWVYGANGRWQKESSLGGASRAYFMQNINGYPSAGTDGGLWVRSGSTWTENPLYPESIFAYLTASWGGENGGTAYTIEAYGKNDGLAFIKQTDSTFLSDHFTPLDGHRIYGLYTNQFIRLGQDSQGNTTETHVDALYLCTELGLYGVCMGAVTGEYNSMLVGREMFGAHPLVVPYTQPNGGVIGVPVKIYNIFQAPPTPPSTTPIIPLIILTSNGVYVVLNWRWCDPDPSQTDLLDFSIQSHSLDGISCFCYATTTTNSTPGYSKCFIGTDRGVYRSLDYGHTWTRCERFVGDSTPVYTLNFHNGYLVAGTSQGLWTSNDDGDTWFKSAPSNLGAPYNSNVSTEISFASGPIAQTFTSKEGATGVLKVSMYISRQPDDNTPNYDLSLNNYLQAQIWTMSGGAPASMVSLTTPPAGITVPDTILAGDIKFPGMVTLYVPCDINTTDTYALVVQEVLYDSSAPYILNWTASTQNNPFASGSVLQKSGGTWTPLDSNLDMFFQVFFVAPATATPTTVNVDFTQGCVNGTVVDDSGSLTTDFKFAGVLVMDDSQSMKWGDPILTRGPELQQVAYTLWDRTFKGTYDATHFDMWTFGLAQIENTPGLSNNRPDIQAACSNNTLTERGLKSDLVDTLGVAIEGLNPQGIVDAIIKPNDTAGNTSRVQTVVTYLQNQDMLRLSSIIAWWNAQNPKSDWNQQSSTIADYDDVSNYLITQWAQTFTPIAIVVSDGDDTAKLNNTISAEDVGLAATTAWFDQGVPIYCFGLNRSLNEGTLRTLSALSGGKTFDISDENIGVDWNSALMSLMHGGSNNLFKATWTQDFDYEEATYIKEVDAAYVTPGGSSCLIQVRYSTDRVNYTPWLTVSNGIPLVIEELVLDLQYQVTLTDGWSGSYPIPASIYSLSHTTVQPSVQYLITNEYPIKGMIFEYLLSAAVDLPATARASWAIGRTADDDFAEFEGVLNNRKGCLPNRQQSILYTPEIVRSRLGTTTGNYQVYTVIDTNGSVARWATTDVVQVFIDKSLIPLPPIAYNLDGANGLVYFNTVQLSTIQVFVTITTPQELYNIDGETTVSYDLRTYYAKNGPWPLDATAIVLVNGKIVRGGFWFAPEIGTVTFNSEREPQDIITIFIQHSDVFRVGVELRNYSNSPITPNDFGLYYGVLENNSIISAFNTIQPPLASNVQLVGTTAHDRLIVNYDYYSPDGTPESGTLIQWYKNGVRVDAYDNRTVEKWSDVSTLFQAGDAIYVTVGVSDGFSVAPPVTSNTVTLVGSAIPYVSNLAISAVRNPLGSSQVDAASALLAVYTFTDPLSGPNMSTVAWYDKNDPKTVIYGASIPANTIVSGQVWSFTVTPYNGSQYGVAHTSEEVVVN